MDSNGVDGGSCVNDSDGWLCFNKNGSASMSSNDCMERIMNEQNYWDHSVESDGEDPGRLYKQR